MKHLRSISFVFLLLLLAQVAQAYPIDGFAYSGIRRLRYIQLVMADSLKGTQPIPGALKAFADIRLQLRDRTVAGMPEVDSDLQSAIDGIFAGLDRNYSVSILDISPGKPLRYASRRDDAGYQPGSVGKLAVATGFFTELARLYPDDYAARVALLKSRVVSAGEWALPNIHTVPIFDLKTNKLQKRLLVAGDEFSLFEWLDHMISVSSNGAASVVWREAVLMRGCGPAYAYLTPEAEEEFWRTTARGELQRIAMDVVNAPLRELGITEDEWRLGSMFTRGAKSRIPGEGGSTGTTSGMIKWLLALEQGKVVDEESSLEIKRLLYQTDKRIRYAQSGSIKDAAVYFKSGSLYKCQPEEGFNCKKYHGNVYNYMNSVAIVEHGDSLVYMVALMSNVLRKNSGSDHMYLASRIEKAIRGE